MENEGSLKALDLEHGRYSKGGPPQYSRAYKNGHRVGGVLQGLLLYGWGYLLLQKQASRCVKGLKTNYSLRGVVKVCV